jgi:hypothetical protein
MNPDAAKVARLRATIDRAVSDSATLNHFGHDNNLVALESDKGELVETDHD